jgi:acyl dehydratase
MSQALTVAELLETEDLDLGVSGWVEITQEDIDAFAEATGDHQWIHVDPDRAADSPFGRTIAHGYLTVSLIPRVLAELFTVTDASMIVNYGLDRLRLTAPVPSDSRVRAAGRLVDAEPRGPGVLHRVDVTVEIDGSDRPALVGTVLLLAYP